MSAQPSLSSGPPIPTVVRPPPPTYSEALNYPVDIQNDISKDLQWNSSSVQPETSEEESLSSEHIYQTLPGESYHYRNPYYNHQLSNHVYSNITEKTDKHKCKYSFRKSSLGTPLSVLEAIPETLASSKEDMGVKTYAQLEVMASGGQRDSELKCERGSSSNCGEVVHSNGKAVLVPINGTVTPDKMIVDALLNDYVRNEGCTCDFRNGGAKIGRDEDNSDSGISNDVQVKRDVRRLSQVADEDEKCSALGENAPLLQNENAQLTIDRDNVDIAEGSSTVRNGERCVRETRREGEVTDSENTQIEISEFTEHLTDRSTDHIVEHIVYSEPEYSSSDVSIKCSGETPNHSLEKCQKTLKRTHNGADHTVYELSPSDSFYNSADNVQAAGEKGPSPVPSADGIARLGQSSVSLTDGQRSHHPLSRETSVSFKKPLVAEPSDCCVTNRTAGHPVEPVVVTADAEPLVSVPPERTESSETIPSNLILDDTRTYYNRKAADRGTLYCACVGITVVATIVFLLIYFS